MGRNARGQRGLDFTFPPPRRPDHVTVRQGVRVRGGGRGPPRGPGAAASAWRTKTQTAALPPPLPSQRERARPSYLELLGQAVPLGAQEGGDVRGGGRHLLQMRRARAWALLARGGAARAERGANGLRAGAPAVSSLRRPCSGASLAIRLSALRATPRRPTTHGKRSPPLTLHSPARRATRKRGAGRSGLARRKRGHPLDGSLAAAASALTPSLFPPHLAHTQRSRIHLSCLPRVERETERDCVRKRKHASAVRPLLST